MPSQPIHVVAAVIEVGGNSLLTRRQPGVHLEGRWEFPGGKIHQGETHGEALARELREELDVSATVSALVLSTTHRYPEKTVTLHFYECAIGGTPRPMQQQEMRWVPREELQTLDFPVADRELIDILSAPG